MFALNDKDLLQSCQCAADENSRIAITRYKKSQPGRLARVLSVIAY